MSDPAPNLEDVALTNLQWNVLGFEQAWGLKPAGAKEAAIRESFGLTSTRYHSLLATAIETPEAEQAYPMLVHRLRDVKDGRGALRSRRRRGAA